MSINRVSISGNLTRDPELRATGGGTQVLSMGVAVNDRRRNQQSGEWEDYPNFVDCTVFGARAESLAPHLAKGSKVAIDGKLRYRSWTDQQTGKRRSALEVVVDEIEFMSPRQQPAYQQQPYAPQPYQQPAYAQAPAPAQARQTYAPQPAPAQPAYAPPRAQARAAASAPVAPAPATQQPAADLYDEDIPF